MRSSASGSGSHHRPISVRSSSVTVQPLPRNTGSHTRQGARPPLVFLSTRRPSASGHGAVVVPPSGRNVTPIASRRSGGHRSASSVSHGPQPLAVVRRPGAATAVHISRNPAVLTTSDVPTIGSPGYLTLQHHAENRHGDAVYGARRVGFGGLACRAGHRPHHRYHLGFGFYWSRRSCPSYYTPYFAYPAVVAAPVYGYGFSTVGVYGQAAVVNTGTVSYVQDAPYDTVAVPARRAPSAPSGVGPITSQQEPAVARPNAEQLYVMMFEGTQAFEAGDYETAARLFMRVALQDPDNVDATLAYAVARFATGDYSIAAIAIRRGVRAYPDVVNAPFDIRDRYASPADMDPHLTTLERFVAEHPDSVDALLVLGFVQHFSRNREAAAETFRRLAELSPSDRELAELFLNAKPLDQIEAEQEATQPAGTDSEEGGS